jgi:hypothetical protein
MQQHVHVIKVVDSEFNDFESSRKAMKARSNNRAAEAGVISITSLQSS